MGTCFRATASFLRYDTGGRSVYRVVLRAALERRRIYFCNTGRELLEDVLVCLEGDLSHPIPPKIQNSVTRGREIVFQVVTPSPIDKEVVRKVVEPLEREWSSQTRVLSLYNLCRNRLDRDPVFTMTAAVSYAALHGADALGWPIGVMQDNPVPKFRKSGVVSFPKADVLPG